MDPLVFIARHAPNKASKDALSALVLERDAWRRGASEQRFYASSVSVRMLRLRLNDRVREFTRVEELSDIRKAIADIEPLQLDRPAATESQYFMMLGSVVDRIPKDQLPRFLAPDGDIYGVIKSVLSGRGVRPSRASDMSLKGAFVLSSEADASARIVKELIVYGTLAHMRTDHEILRYEVNRRGRFKLKLGFQARYLWLEALR